MEHPDMIGYMGWPRSAVITNCATCNAPVKREPNQLANTRRSFCGEKCRSAFLSQLTGPLSPTWKGGRVMGPGPYVRVKIGRQHPMADAAGYVLEHRLVMATHLGRMLTRSEHVHHVNGVQSDNKIENLRLFAGNGDHKRFHTEQKSKRLCRCGKPHEAKGLCTSHYAKWRRGTSSLSDPNGPSTSIR